MDSGWNVLTTSLAASAMPEWVATSISVIKVVIGFSIIIFVHELGHFLAAKWAGIRVDRFAVGFGYRVLGWRGGEGLTFGRRPSYTPQELREKSYGETDYCLNVLPFGGYVKMLGQEDIVINEQTGDIKLSDDPRAFTNKPVGKRMVVVSAGVVFNLVFALVAYTAVFMMGRTELAPRLGPIDASTPAAQAGLRPGDTVLAVNDEPVKTFRDIAIAVLLSEGNRVSFRVERDGRPLPDTLIMELDDAADRVADSGLVWLQAPVLANVPQTLARFPELEPGDRITHVAGKPIESANQFALAFTREAIASQTRAVEVSFERSNPDDPQQPTRFTLALPARLEIAPTEASKTELLPDSAHVLGLTPRRRVEFVQPDGPGERAGIQAGDVSAQWGGIPHPLYSDIVNNIQSNAGRPTPIVVERNGQSIALSVTPRRPFQLFGQARAQVGVAFEFEDGMPVVAYVAENSPADAMKLPRGAQLVEIDGQPVQDWFDVVRRFEAAAGRAVAVRYRTGAIESTGTLDVPATIMTELNLPRLAVVLSVDGQSTVTLKDKGPTLRLPHPLALAALLKQRAGQTVTIRYQPAPDDLNILERTFAIAPDGSNADPWQFRIDYVWPRLTFRPLETVVQTGNPVRAAGLAVEHTGNVLIEMYRVLRTLVRGVLQRDTTGVQHVSGPVGIVGAAVDKAKQGFASLLDFLAFLSVNLAVINFVPFPVVDGGLMVFLLIEKIKGKPLSIKTQMVATLVGLATIILVFVLVTFKDITRLMGG